MTQNVWASLDKPKQSNTWDYVSKFEEWVHKFRITWTPAVYYEFFGNDNKPVKSSTDFEQKYFEANCKTWTYWQQKSLVWALPAWDYQQEKQVVLQLKKSALINDLRNLANDEDWGDPTKYDIKIKREWKDKETKYSLTPTAPKEIWEDIKESLKKLTINVDVLVDNGNPFQIPNIDEGADIDDWDEDEVILSTEKDDLPF